VNRFPPDAAVTGRAVGDPRDGAPDEEEPLIQERFDG
jgi:hypothetical protein